MLEPQVIRKKRPLLKECTHCKEMRNGDEYVISKSWFYADGLAPVCNVCIKQRLVSVDWAWDEIDKLCQVLDIPFIPKEFERMHAVNGDDVFPVYAQMLQEEPYEPFGWLDYFEKFKELRELKMIEEELPELYEEQLHQMRLDWGMTYDEEQLHYLENLYNGLLATQNVTGALQVDQARKLAKISLAIDDQIRQGEDFAKLMGSYDKLIKTADFTPKNVKNENDFDSFGEAAAWLERRGWMNEYYDGAEKDVVDEVIQNLQAFNQRLYINEPNIGEEVSARIEALKIAHHLEQPSYGIDQLDKLDEYEDEGYSALIKEELILDEDDD